MTSVLLALVTLTFSVRGDRARGWPVKTEVTLASAATTKQWTIEAADARKPVALKVDPGKYTLTITAPLHRVYTKTIEIDKDLSLPEIALAAVPAISGRVVERVKDAETPLAGAQIMHGERKLTTTDAQGYFRVALTSDPTPESVTIVHAGQVPKTIPLFASLAAENELGTIELDRGNTLTVQLDRRYDEPKMVTVSLFDRRVIASREVTASEDEVRFTGVAPGTYLIVVKGTEPLEVMQEKVEVQTGDVEHRVTIAPFPLDGRVLVGNESLTGGGKIEISARAWRTEVPLDDEGRFGGTMWQQGKVTGWLRTSLAPTPIMEVSPDLGPGPSTWQIALKRRFIEGRIFDRDTNRPVADASLELEIVSGEQRSLSAVSVAKDGSYSVPAMQNGRYEFRVSAPEHTDARRVVSVNAMHSGQILDFALEGGVEAIAAFAWPDGKPVAGATVLSNDARNYRTGSDGRVTIRMTPGSTRTLIALPREGSFGIADLAAGRRGAPALVQVVVPQPAGGLRIATFDKNRAPVRRPITVSFNGRMLPGFVVQQLARESSPDAPLRLLRLPAGFYDVRMAGAPPARVSVNAGEVVVELVATR